MQKISLLNSVIGPVMRGPSSSHAAGPHQIARVIRQLSTSDGEGIRAATIRFHPKGSFAAVYENQGSDEGFAAGLLDVPIVDVGYREALGRVNAGLELQCTFEVTDTVLNDHPNRVEIEVVVRDGAGMDRRDTFRAVSSGGGMFAVDGIGAERLSIDGTKWFLVVEGHSFDTSRVLGVDGALALDERGPGAIAQFSMQGEPTSETVRAIGMLDGVTRVRVSAPTQLSVHSDAVLLTSSTDLIAGQIDLADQALRVESVRLGLSQKRVRLLFEERCALMMSSVTAGLEAPPSADGMKYLEPSARRVQSARVPVALDSDFLRRAMAAALAVMEQNTNRGVVVASPTAGSAGIVPGILYSLRCSGLPDSQLVDALQVAALVGGVFAVNGGFAAEEGGCAVETGASAAMAAGGLVSAMGGTPTEAFRAASLCLMNTLGLVCDPVAGEVEIPCHARNIAGVAHAHAAAIAVMAGFDAVIDFDDMVKATVEVGQKMHPDLLCTARGGCASCRVPTRVERRGGPVPIDLAHPRSLRESAMESR
ncbi:MAG: L-serine ammonia-lyase [Microbacterium sp.]|jgi:L-serine dehydratase|nr:L-serine ammonia-lyase [Microbacterium sp.]